eukprot:09903.XXX_565393_565973_1 [CDS] Oithona nana genome sequencing.
MHKIVTTNWVLSVKMKSLVALVFVMAFIGLAQPALINTQQRLRGGESSSFLSRKIIQDFFEAISKTTATAYQNGLWFITNILKKKTKNSELKDPLISIY